MSQGVELLISCHCGAAKQTVVLCAQPGNPSDVDLCHCHACRHGSGLLCVSYTSIQKPPRSLGGLVSYQDDSSPHAPPAVTLYHYFCDTCGCHVFRHRKASALIDSEGQSEDDEVGTWEVATGIIVGRADAGSATIQAGDVEVGGEGGGEEPLLRFARHVNTDSTKDGGLSPFISLVEGSKLEVSETRNTSSITPPPSTGEREVDDSDDVLEAYCRCKAIRFRITRPDASSRLPRSGFPDLTVPFAATPREEAGNPRDEKWWLRAEGRAADRPARYLAGTCACGSCRLTSGFEVQTWTFVPRSNIFFLPPMSPLPTTPTSPSSLSPAPKPIPLDFAILRQQGVPLKGYDSSPGRRREFCPSCGATVFWHDRVCNNQSSPFFSFSPSFLVSFPLAQGSQSLPRHSIKRAHLLP